MGVASFKEEISIYLEQQTTSISLFDIGWTHRPKREANITLYSPCTWCKNCYELETDVTDDRRSRMWGMPTHPPAPLPACVDLPLIRRRLHGKE